MRDRRNTRTLLLTSAAVFCAAIALAAQAQTVSSPFAKKAKKQAWETDAPSQPQAPASRPNLRGGTPSSGTYVPQAQPIRQPRQLPSPGSTPSVQGTSSGTYVPQPTYAAKAQPQPSAPTYYGNGSSYAAPTAKTQPQPKPQPYQSQNSYNYSNSGQASTLSTGGSQSSSGAYYPGRSANTAPQTRPQTGYQARGAQTPRPQKPSWKDRLGFSNIATVLSGYLKLGAGASERDGWGEDFVADGSVRGEVSAITSGGLEYGAGLELRGQYDKYRRGFGGRVGECSPTVAGCASALVMGAPTALRGHTSQFYTSGPDNAKDAEYALEGAYLFLRSAYGDVTIGRDDGAAYLFSLGAPSLMAVGASNSSVDYTGLDSVKTVNDASGFSEKIIYTSPRLLGDTVGVGVQFGASYALDAKACGVDYCVQSDAKHASNSVSPDLEDIFEFGVSLDRKFDNGFSVEATATYAMGSEKSNLDAFADLKALGLGLELGYGDFTLGGSYLDSNNGLMEGDYTAWDAGLTWKPSRLGFTAGYGHAVDKNVNLKSDQAVLGVSYDWNEYFRLGTGVQYIEREAPFVTGGVVTPTKEKATSVFVEGKVTF